MNDEATTHLVLEIFLHDGRYHGVPDWPPAPARVFQALVAGSGRGATVSPDDLDVLAWLEGLGPPVIGAPIATRGQEVGLWVPNNDLDAKGGDPDQMGSIRTQKKVRPWIFDAEVPLLYAWPLDEAPASLDGVERLADGLYQLGRGVDMAWARARILSTGDLDRELAAYPGARYRPGPGQGGTRLDVPMSGSLESLQRRFQAHCSRFETQKVGRKAVSVFSQAPKPRFTRVTYEAKPSRRLFELELEGRPGKLDSTPLQGAGAFTQRLRDVAAERLVSACPELRAPVERSLIGREAEGRRTKPNLRVRILPLPSHGHEQVDPSIRRVLVEVPGGCELREDDVFWAFTGAIPETDTGAALSLVPTNELDMLGHYGVSGRPSRIWRSVTPVCLPESARRRRIDPLRQQADAKKARERTQEEDRAVNAVAQALRHAGIRERASEIHVRREPFTARGARAEAFEHKPRFTKERLWHVEIELERPISGPLCIGDGRFFGLGLMAPLRQSAPDVFALDVLGGLSPQATTNGLVRALRRAILARVQAELPPRKAIPRTISGHEADGTASRANHNHIAIHFEPATKRFLITAPHRLTGQDNADWAVSARLLDRALDQLHVLLAGSGGRIELRRTNAEASCRHLLSAARTWTSATPYLVTRHERCGDAREAVARDLHRQCLASGLPAPRVEVIETRSAPGRGLQGSAVLHFATAVQGPIALGRSRHLGGGLFQHCS